MVYTSFAYKLQPYSIGGSTNSPSGGNKTYKVVQANDANGNEYMEYCLAPKCKTEWRNGHQFTFWAYGTAQIGTVQYSVLSDEKYASYQRFMIAKENGDDQVTRGWTFRFSFWAFESDKGK